jgi:heme/copper-type cytochrome/quinol oxidase subunit 2
LFHDRKETEKDITPSISTAYAINHISVIIIPIIGVALLAVVSFGFVQKIRVPVKQDL